MSDKLTIRITVEGEGNDETLKQTVSKFAVTDKGQITIYNDAAADAVVEFAGASPLCKGNQAQNPATIKAKGKEEYKACDNAVGLSFKYTATVGVSKPEDPILIVERGSPGGGAITNPIFFPETWIGFAAGLLVAWGLMRLLGKKTTQMQK